MWSRSSRSSAGVRKTVSSTPSMWHTSAWHGFEASTPAHRGVEGPRPKAVLGRDGFPTHIELLHPPRDCRLGDGWDRHRTKHRVYVAHDVGAVAGESFWLDTRQVVDVGVQPLVAVDFVELDDAKRLVGTVV